jgi:hypothetical protein
MHESSRRALVRRSSSAHRQHRPHLPKCSLPQVSPPELGFYVGLCKQSTGDVDDVSLGRRIAIGGAQISKIGISSLALFSTVFSGLLLFLAPVRVSIELDKTSTFLKDNRLVGI